MAAPSELSNLIDELTNCENIIEKLIDIKTLILAIHPNDLRDVVPNVSFNVVFTYLDSTDREQTEVCSDVLNKLLSAVDPTVLLQNFHTEFVLGLQHQEKSVVTLTLTQLHRASSASTQQVASHSDIIVLLVRLLSSEQLDNVKFATNILVLIGNTAEGISQILQGPAFAELLSVMDQGDVIRYRCYDMLVRIGCCNAESLRQVAVGGFLTKLLNELNTDDTLLQLNVLELVTMLATVSHGYQYLAEHGTVDKLMSMMGQVQSDPLQGLLLPGLIKVFGHIGQQQPELVSSGAALEPFLHLVFETLASSDLTVSIIAAETVAFIGSTEEGKRALNKQGNKMTEACQRIGSLARSSPQEIRVKALDAVKDLISLPVHEQCEELLAITRQWARSLWPGGVSQMITLAQQPFAELRLAGMQLLNALAVSPWGQETLNHHPGFLEYLLDRSTEREKEGKQAKWEIVNTLVESPTASNIFGQPNFLKLREFHREGPFFIKTESAVAFEGE